jgi:O-antigen/teichoic acid export membrane protein
MIKGASFIAAQAVIGQVLAFGARIIVYRELGKTEEGKLDIGLAIWVFSACNFLTWLQPLVGEVLIQRQTHFKRWANAGFWLCAFDALLLLVIGMVMGPAMGFFRESWQVFPLVAVTTLSMGFAMISMVWIAEHTIRFDFRLMAWVGTAAAVAGAVSSIVLAYAGAGPWTLILPPLIINGLTAILLFKTSGFRPRLPVPRRWRLLIGPSVVLAVAGFFASLVTQADKFFLGIFQPEALGAFAIAYALSLQMIQLVSRSLRGVLLPALSMNSTAIETRNQRYLETIRLAGLITMPASLLLIPAARPLLLLLLPDWETMVPLFQVFQVGMGFTVLHVIAFTAMQSWGLFRRYLFVNVVMGTIFVPLMWGVASQANVTFVAGTVVVYYVLTALATALLAIWTAPGRLPAKVISAALVPWMIGAASAAAGTWCAVMMGLAEADWRFAAVALTVGMLLYAACALVFMRAPVENARQRLSAVILRGRRQT